MAILSSPWDAPADDQAMVFSTNPSYRCQSMTLTADIPAPGQIARVRQRLYLVERTVSPPNPGDSTLVALSCVDDDAQGQRLEVLWDREIDREIMKGEAWDAIAKRGFDSPQLIS